MSAAKVQPKSRFLILYASQTGQAKAISEEITSKALQLGLKPDLFCMSLTDKRFSIEKETCVVFIVSTTGDAQPPDTAIKFIRRLNRNTLKANYLEKLNYTLLALGDSNYLRFAAFGRLLEHRLNALSARNFYPTGYGDDAFGIETGVDPWIDNLWPALHKQLGIDFVKNSAFDSYNLTNGINHKVVNMNTSGLTADFSSKDITSLRNLPSILETIHIEECRVPKLPLAAYQIVFDEALENNGIFTPNESTLVLPDSSLVQASLISGRKLAFGDDIKHVLELTFKFMDKVIEYVPGDAFGFLCPNNNEEVDWLLERLGLTDVANTSASLVLHKECSVKRKLPAHIPPSFSVKEVFLHCVEIRAVPKKILLRILAEYTEDDEEKKCLLFLASQEGSSCFVDLIRKPSLSILDILMHYTLCKPPSEKIIEYLPPLKPRFYSVASSPLVDKHTFRIVFSVLKMKSCDGRLKEREGVCTGWLNHLASDKIIDSSLTIADKLSGLKLDDGKAATVYIYKRKNPFFRFPESLKTPLIMVGPGTGIAPFIGYLQHREKLIQLSPKEARMSETWLFYGCRYKENDFLYRTELDRLVQFKVLQSLILSFSRDAQSSELAPRYVHENIKLHAKKIANCIHSGGKILVCGDAKHMAHDVQEAFIKALQIGSGINESEAKMAIESLQKEHRYINDVWA